MSYFTEDSPMYSPSDTSPLSTISAASCGPNCSCRTVSCIGSTTPRFARVQLNPHEQRETFESPSVNISNDDLLEDSDAPNDDASKQDFDFEDVFNYDEIEYSPATSSNDNSGSVLEPRQKTQADFSFSNYAGNVKGAGHVKMTKTKSGCLRPRVARAKSGCRRAD